MMDVKTALLKRKSTRAFLDKEVSIDVINEIIEQSKTAPSGVNTQPWQVAVLTGESKDNLCNKFEKAFREGIKARWIISIIPWNGKMNTKKEERNAAYCSTQL